MKPKPHEWDAANEINEAWRRHVESRGHYPARPDCAAVAEIIASQRRQAATLASARSLVCQLNARRAGRSLRVFAAELGCSFQFLAKVLRGQMPPGPELARRLGYEPVTLYRRQPATHAHRITAPAGALPKGGRQISLVERYGAIKV